MMEEKQTPQVDKDNLYSRQIGVFGAEAMGKLVKLRVFIQGLKGVRFYLILRLVLKLQKISFLLVLRVLLSMILMLFK